MQTNKSEIITIDEIKDGKYIASWQEKDMASAIASVNTLKITGAGKVFSLQNQAGTVLAVIKM